jgi:hypothetical protein
MACRNCGHDIPPDATVCPECGADLAGLHDATAQSGQYVAALRAAEDAYVPPPHEPGGVSIVAVVAIVAAILLLAGAVVFTLYNVTALQLMHERALRRAAITQQTPIPAPNTVGQTDPESLPGEPDVATTTNTAPPASSSVGTTSPEGTVVQWYEALKARDAARLKKLVVPALDPAVTAILSSGTTVTGTRHVSTTFRANTVVIVVQETSRTSRLVQYTLAFQPDGTWVIIALR